MMRLLRRRPKATRLEVRPHEMLETVVADFVGQSRPVSTRYRGLTYETVHSVTIERITSIVPCESRAVVLAGLPKSVLSMGDLELQMDEGGERSSHRLRDIAIPVCRRDPETGRLTGRLIADRIVPRPVPPRLEVAAALDEDLEEEPPTSGAIMTYDPPLVDDIPLRRVAARAVSEPSIQYDSSVTQPLDLAPSYAPALLLGGTRVGADREGKMGAMALTVRSSATGAPLSGTLRVQNTAGAWMLGGDAPRSFGREGFTFMAQGGDYLAHVAVHGHCDAVLPIKLVAGAQRSQDLIVEPINTGTALFRAELSWDDPEADLSLHLVHIGPDELSFHISNENVGRLDEWPFASFESPTEGRAVTGQAIGIARALQGKTFCFVHDRKNRHNPEATALGDSGALVELEDASGRTIAVYEPPRTPGNIWCVFVLADGEPVALGDVRGFADEIDSSVTDSWRDDERIPVTQAVPFLERSAGVIPGHSRLETWGFLFCLLIGALLTLYVYDFGSSLGAVVMTAVTIAVLYFVRSAGYPIWPWRWPSFAGVGRPWRSLSRRRRGVRGRRPA